MWQAMALGANAPAPESRPARAARIEARADLPNILWITCEDMSPNLGCYGDRYADTPNIDRLASQSVRFTRAFATSPTCSPARSTLITGVHATTLGTLHLRSRFAIPAHMKGFPSYLRAAGYFCSNNGKTDYNTRNEPEIIEASWDVNSSTAHWRDRRPGQPFFCVFNDMTTHQSRSMVWPYEQFEEQVQSRLDPARHHDPAKAPLPPYYPESPVIRRTLARYYDCISVMDQNVGKLLSELEEDGLADDTIVFFFSDHGAGLPRHKRACLDSGLHVPLLIRFPEKYRHLALAPPGTVVDRLVSFVDFPATVLSLVGRTVPEYMQGCVFLGPGQEAPREFVVGSRGRVDEAYDMVRSVRTEDFHYVRTYMPHLSYNQPSVFPDQGTIRREITELFRQGRLSGPQLHYAGPTRPREELYDVNRDPQQLHNLVSSAKHQRVREAMRRRLRDWMATTRDVGLLPEVEMARRCTGATPYELGRHPERYPRERILRAAELVGGGRSVVPEQVALLRAPDAAVRYWAAVGLNALGSDAVEAADALAAALADPAPNVRIEAAAALCNIGESDKGLGLLRTELRNDDLRVVLHAARAAQLLGAKARPIAPTMREVLEVARAGEGDPSMFVQFALEAAVRQLEP